MASEDVGCNFSTKEYWLIIYLVAMDYKIVNIECKQDDRGQDFLLWTFPAEAAEEEKRYIRNEVMQTDLHSIRTAADMFKKNLQYFRIRG